MKLILPSTTPSLTRLNHLLSGKAFAGSRFFILVDEHTSQHCLPRLIAEVEALQEAEFFEVPAGEECKALEIAAQLWQSLLESGADRQSVIVNLGGGTVSDLGGFVAAAYQRGIRYVNIPTTLIGMADAAIGGKTALDLQNYKNQVGFFHSPDIVCIEPSFLDTLPRKELVGGLFEMLKTLLLAEPEMYERLLSIASRPTLKVPPEMIAACAHIKSAIVKKDPKEHGIRRVLNLGHTFGHGIESFCHQPGQQPLPHGHAVGLGMACALYLSVMKLGLPQEVLAQYRQCLFQLVAPPRYSLRDTEEILAYMRHDKKNADGELHCVLLQAPGAPVIDLAVSEAEARTALLHIAD